MDSKVSEKDMREIYFQAFGKEYDSEDRKQAQLPIEIAYLVALQKLKKDGKYAGGGDITDDNYYQSVNHFVYFCFNYPNNFYDAFDSNLKNHLSNKFKDYYNKYGTLGVMMNFYAELDAENRILFTNWILKNYKGSPISSDISEKEYHNIVNHFFYFSMNYPSNFLDAFSSYLKPHLSEKWTSAYEKKGTMGAMIQFWSELDTENRKDFCIWIKKNYTGTPLYELGGGLGDVAGMLPSPLPMSTIQPMANGGQIYIHKHDPKITLEFIDYTNKGIKGLQKDPSSLSKKERKEGKIVYYSDSELKELFNKEKSDREYVKVIFENPKYNYVTSVNPNSTEEEIRKYFVGKFFDVGIFPQENIQKAIEIEFVQGEESYELGGGLGDVAGMLPSPLPMSTIQAMADGGGVNDEGYTTGRYSTKKTWDVFEDGVLQGRVQTDRKDEFDIIEILLRKYKLRVLRPKIKKHWSIKLSDDIFQFSNGGALGDVAGMLPSPLPMSTIQAMADGGGVGISDTDIKSLEGHWSSYNKGVMSGKQDEGYTTIKNEEDLNNYITTKIGDVVKDIKVIEKEKNYPYNRSNPYYEDTYLVTLKNGTTFEVERSYGSPNWSGNVNYKEQIKIKNINIKYEDGGDLYDSEFKEGVKVETIVFMSTEDIGSDEDIEAGTIGNVLSEPNDREDLVLVEIKGIRYYLPQDVLVVVDEDFEFTNNNDDCINSILTSVNKIKPIADFGISDKKLIIIVKKQLTIDEIELLNNNLKNIKGCSEITDDEFTISYKENNKTLILNLKTDDFSIQKFKNGGGVDIVKKDRYGNDVKIGDAIHIIVLTGRYGQTKDYEGIVTNFDEFGNVELDGERSIKYTTDYTHNDYEHGHHIWVEKINKKDINENLRIPKKYVPTYSGTINGERFVINGKEKFQEWLDENYPNSIFDSWYNLHSKGWRYRNNEYFSPENLPYKTVDTYRSAEQGQGFLYSLMIPKENKFSDGGNVSGFLSDSQIDKLNKLEVYTYLTKIDPLGNFNVTRGTTKSLREIAKKITHNKKSFSDGGGVDELNVGYNVFNYTDNIYATDEVFKTKALANKFIKEFRNRFSNQGYYRDNRMNKINIQDIDLLAIPSNFNPLKKYGDGGGVDDFDSTETSMVVYHEKVGNWLVPKGQVYLYVYDNKDGAKKLQSNEYDWVFYPMTSPTMAFQSDYIPPLEKIWTKNFQKEYRGSEYLLGVVKAFLIDKENGEKELYIDMMSVNPTKKKKGIMSFMIKKLRNSFKLSQNQVTFSQLTKEGEKFVEKGKYSDGGGIDDCIEYIKNSESIKNNGYYLHIDNMNNYVGSNSVNIPKIDSLSLITFNSGGQKNLKAVDTINSVLLASEIANLLNIDIEIARIIVYEQTTYSKPFTMDMLDGIKNKNIIIADRDTIVCTNLSMQFSSGGGVDVDLEDDFKKALVTSNFTYYTDNSDGIRMFRNSDNEELTGGVFAENSLSEDVENNDIVWASEDMKYIINAMREEYSLGGLLLSAGAGAFAYKIYLDYKRDKNKKRLEDFIKDEAKYYTRKIKSKINIEDDFQEKEERASRRRLRDSDDMFQEKEERTSRRGLRDSDDIFQERE